MTPQELAELDLAVAKAEGRPPEDCEGWADERYSPTRDGAEAMRLLEKYHIDLNSDEDRWAANAPGQTVWHWGPTPAIAICRAVVALAGK